MMAQTSTLAVISLISAIAGFVILWGIGPIIAVITGHMAKSEIRNSMGRLTGDGLATAGLILGYLQIGLLVIGCCIFAIMTAAGVTLPFCMIPWGNLQYY